jgi:hypothetical protein
MPAAARRNLIVVPRPIPAAARRNLIVVPRPLPAAALEEHRRAVFIYLNAKAVARGGAHCASNAQVLHRGA